MKCLSLAVALALTPACAHAVLSYVPQHADPSGLPIAICVNAAVDFDLQVDTLDAMEQWNKALGGMYLAWRCPPVELQPDLSSYKKARRTPPPLDYIHVGQTTLESLPPPSVAMVLTWPPVESPGRRGYLFMAEPRTPASRYNLMLHELGHVLGLAHDNGIMWPHADIYEKQEIDEAALEAVRKLWGGEPKETQ